MYILAKIVFRSYSPLKLEKCMWFLEKKQGKINRTICDYTQVHTLNHLPEDKDAYITDNGFPVEPYIVAQNQNPDDVEIVLVTPEHIGINDNTKDNVHNYLSMYDINYTLMYCGGWVEIEVKFTDSEDPNDMIPVLIDGKANILLMDDEAFGSSTDNDDDEDWNDMDELIDDEEYYDIGGSE